MLVFESEILMLSKPQAVVALAFCKLICIEVKQKEKEENELLNCG